MSEAAQPPVPPREPELDECCGSGCRVCVFDRYEQALEAYRAQLRVWQTAQSPEGRDE
jgi:hypothetical protein